MSSVSVTGEAGTASRCFLSRVICNRKVGSLVTSKLQQLNAPQSRADLLSSHMKAVARDSLILFN